MCSDETTEDDKENRIKKNKERRERIQAGFSGENGDIIKKKIDTSIDGWISVKNAIPETSDRGILVHFENGSIETVHVEDYFDDITCGLDENGIQLYTKWYKSQGVTHWQELPRPPKEVG